MDVKAATDAANPSRTSRKLRAGKDEFSFAMFPLGGLSHHLPTDKERKQKQYKRSFQGSVWSEEASSFLPASVTLITDPDVGLPNAYDEALFVALINLAIIQTGGELVPAHRYHFLPSELLTITRRDKTGRTWSKLIPDAMERLEGVRLVYKYAWFDYQQEHYNSRLAFRLIGTSSYTTNKDTKNKPNDARAWITFNDEFCLRFNSGVIKPLDLKVYFSFESAIAKRMYRIFNKMRHDGTYNLDRDLADFAFGNVGLSRDAYTYYTKTDTKKEHPKIDYGKIKHRFAAALAEHEQANTIKPADRDHRYHKVSPGVWRIRAELPRMRASKPKSFKKIDPLTQELIDLGITPTTAKQLVKDSDQTPENIRLQIDCLEARVKASPKEVPSPTGLLIASIKGKWKPPANYTPKAQLDAQAKKAKAQLDALNESTQQVRANDEANEKRVSDYIAALSPDQRHQLELDAFKNPPAFHLKQFRKHERAGETEAAEDSKHFIITHHVKAHRLHEPSDQ